MSYRLINANALNGVISNDDYEKVLNASCIFADLPNGLDGEYYNLQEPTWIPVSEKLPENNVEVLATTEWGAVTIAEMYSANDWFIHEGTTNAETDEIAAWMPLPKPYKAESEE